MLRDLAERALEGLGVKDTATFLQGEMLEQFGAIAATIGDAPGARATLRDGDSRGARSARVSRARRVRSRSSVHHISPSRVDPCRFASLSSLLVCAAASAAAQQPMVGYSPTSAARERDARGQRDQASVADERVRAFEASCRARRTSRARRRRPARAITSSSK